METLDLALAVGVVTVLLLGSTRPTEGGQATAPPRPDDSGVPSDSDPTHPVFASIRPELYTIGDGIAVRALVFRYDTALLTSRSMFHGVPGVIFRVEAPLAAARAGDGGRAQGVGDAYGQFLIVPYTNGGFAWAVGSGVVVPTATDDLLGAGKWVLAPLAAPVWRSPGVLFFVKVQNLTSIAGDASRSDLNYLLVTPTFFHVIHRQWWVLLDTESKTNWARGDRTGLRSGVQIGRVLARGVGFWAKPEMWWGPNRDGRWNLKFGVVWYERRSVPDSHSGRATQTAF